MFSREFCEIFKNILFTEDPWMNASIIYYILFQGEFCDLLFSKTSLATDPFANLIMLVDVPVNIKYASAPLFQLNPL